MAVGIPSAAVLRVQAGDAALETSRAPISPLITEEGPTAHGTPLAHPGAPLQAWPRGGLHDQGRCTAAPVPAARTPADPLSAIPLLLDRVRVILRTDPLGLRDSDQAGTWLAARASIPMVAIADLATMDLAAAGDGMETVGTGTAMDGVVSAGMATAGTEAFGRDTTTTVGAATDGVGA